jgi:signal transduction histidine kinase
MSKFLHQVKDDAERMTNLLQDLLELNKLKGKPDGIDVVDAALVAELARKQFEEVIGKKGATVLVQHLPAVRINGGHLLVLFQNLLSNALKYDGAIPPEVLISAGINGSEWIFSVKDNGIGIDPRYQSTIFEPYKRLHSHTKYDGTGLGLAICKSIVEKYGGRIWVESMDGKGSTFCFALPQETAPSDGFPRQPQA